MECISCQDLANDYGQTEEEEEEDGIAFPELRSSLWLDATKNLVLKLEVGFRMKNHIQNRMIYFGYI